MTAPTVSRARARPAELGSSSRQASPGLARARIACSSPADKATTCGWAGPADLAEDAARDQPEADHVPRRVDRRAAVGTGLERRHQPQLAQARQLEPEHPPRPQVGLAQMPQRDPRRVEQLGVRVVQVGQLVQQLGDVIAGIQGRQIAAERCEAFHRRGLGQKVQRLGRLGYQHDIGNPQQVKATLHRRLRPPRPLGQRADLPQLAGEQASPPGWSRRPRSSAAPGPASASASPPWRSPGRGRERGVRGLGSGAGRTGTLPIELVPGDHRAERPGTGRRAPLLSLYAASRRASGETAPELCIQACRKIGFVRAIFGRGTVVPSCNQVQNWVRSRDFFLGNAVPTCNHAQELGSFARIRMIGTV